MSGYQLVCLSMFACKWVCYSKLFDVFIKRTSPSFMGAILKKYLVQVGIQTPCSHVASSVLHAALLLSNKTGKFPRYAMNKKDENVSG